MWSLVLAVSRVSQAGAPLPCWWLQTSLPNVYARRPDRVDKAPVKAHGAQRQVRQHPVLSVQQDCAGHCAAKWPIGYAEVLHGEADGAIAIEHLQPRQD